MMAYSKRDIECAFPGGKWSNGEYLIKSPLRPEERTASFRINPEKASYFDFGSGQGGKLSELFTLTGQDDPFHGEDGASASPRSREAEEKILKRQAAINLWEAAGDAAGHPYLSHKKVEAYGARRSNRGVIWKDGRLKEMTGDFLIVPAYGPDGSMIGIEQIAPSGKQKYDLGEKGVFVLGEYRAGVPLLVAEGFSTAASLKKISGWNAACCGGTANIRAAVETLRKQFSGDIFVTPDTGAEDFTDVADVIEIPGEHPKNTDWNDLLSAHGIEAAKDLFKDGWTNVRKRKQPETSIPKKKGIETISARDLRLSVLKAPEWAVEGLIPEGITILAGRPKGGKSWLILQACLAVASGQDFLGHKTTKGKVLYAALEDTNYRLKSRIGKLWDDDRTVPADLLATTDIPRLNPEGIEILEEWIKANNPRMVVLDTWAKSKDAGDKRLNAYEQDVRLVSSIKRLADQYHLCLVLIHHLNKLKVGDENWLESLSGSMGLSGTADAILSLKRDMGQDNAILKRTGRDFENTDDLALEWTLEGWVNNGPAKGKTITEERQEIIRSIKGAGEPVTPSYIADDLGKKAGNVRVMLHKMVQAGLIRRTSNNRYQLPPPKEEKEEVFLESGNGGNTDNGSNTGNGGNGGNAGNGGNYGGVTGALPEGGNAVQAGDSKVLSGSVTGVTGVTTSGKPVYNPSDGESRQGNLEQFFPGGMRTGLSIPRGPSLSELASRAGVSVEAVQEELSRWEECKRVSLDGDKIILLEGNRYPGQDEPEPPEESPAIEPKEPPSAGPGQGGLFQDEPQQEEDPSSCGKVVYSPDMARAWLESQPEAVQAEYRAKVKRLKGVDMPDYEAVALLRTWEQFGGRR
jgi:predicted transcriptional regulator